MTFRQFIATAMLSLLLAGNATLSPAAPFDTASLRTSVSFGGFSGPGMAPISVEQARVTLVYSRVIVRGRIAQHVGDEQYVFEDATSSVLVTIPGALWQGQVITPKNLVELHGETARSPSCVQIRVARLVKIY